MRRKSAAALCIACFTLLGCLTCCFLIGGPGDPVRTTRQILRLRVVDSASGDPVVGVNVEVKQDYEHSEGASRELQRRSKQGQGYLREWWAELPWFSCVTDNDGRAEAAIVTTALDRTWGSRPPASRDTITAEPYFVRLNASHEPQETLRLLMRTNEVVKGKRFAVTVIEIEQPVYIAER
jgi:hypothetical protein